MTNNENRFGLVALLGEPNVGKSTLINSFIGTKISIVTHKAQTTRERVRGILIQGTSQIVLIDTPGVFTTKKSRLDTAMVSAAWQGALGADIILFMLEANRGLTNEARAIIKSIRNKKNFNCIIALVLNKIDRVKKEKLLILCDKLNSEFNFQATFMISAKKSQGVSDLKKWLATNLPKGPWLYPKEQVADFPLKSFAAELTREKLLIRLHQEVPYQLTVEPEDWIELPDGSIKVNQIILVANKRYKGIVLGKKGEIIKWVSTNSRKELVRILQREIHLFLRVRVRENWYNELTRFQA